MTAASSQPVRGSRFPTLEKYDVLEELGHGGMATVYRARDLRLGRDVAVKVIHPHLRDSADAVRRFSIEARAVAKLRHANIVEVYDVSAPSDAEQYLVVELLRGVTLRRLLEQHGALPAEVAVSLGVELLSALAHAHDAGVIHRDVKPENVIVEHRPPRAAPAEEAGSPAPPPVRDAPSGSFKTPSPSHAAGDSAGDRVAVKLTDFGIAKLLDAQGVTSTGQVLGSPAHMAPEQIEGRDVDARADVFGIGVLLYECMVGHLPFQGTNPAQMLRRVLEGQYPSAEDERPTVGRTWSRILDQALASDVTLRFASAPVMRDALLRELARIGVTSPRAEIEAWLDDPAGFTTAHQAMMTTRLCALAEAASRRGDVLTSAADYNRALAYSPNDAALLKLVSRMNRSRARRDQLRRALPVTIAALLLAGGVTAATALVKRAGRGHPTLQPEMALSVAPIIPLTPPAVILPTTVPAEIASSRTLAHPSVVSHPSPPRSSSREVRFSSVEPGQGVFVSIDGSPTMPVDQGKPLIVDDKAHSLRFSCASDLCAPIARAVEPGDRAITLPVHMTIKPSTLIIRGTGHYYLAEDPMRPLSTSENGNLIPMTQSAVRVVRVVEQETNTTKRIELHAGKTSEPVDFGAP
jgi:serine/threonine-protein kinase